MLLDPNYVHTLSDAPTIPLSLSKNASTSEPGPRFLLVAMRTQHVVSRLYQISWGGGLFQEQLLTLEGNPLINEPGFSFPGLTFSTE